MGLYIIKYHIAINGNSKFRAKLLKYIFSIAKYQKKKQGLCYDHSDIDKLKVTGLRKSKLYK